MKIFLHSLIRVDLYVFEGEEFHYRCMDVQTRARQRAGFFRAGFRVALRVPGPGENPDINYVFLHLNLKNPGRKFPGRVARPFAEPWYRLVNSKINY